MKLSRYVVWGILLFLTFGFQFVVFAVGPFWLKGS